MIGLWDTTGDAIVAALSEERRSAGGVTSGLALTLIVIADEAQVRMAEAAATVASATHPCRLLIVMRSTEQAERSRLDAEIVVGGRLGPCEAVVMRLLGPLAEHADSVVMPLLAPDVPVVTWWEGAPPSHIADDPLGVVAERRITDCARASSPMESLQHRALEYSPGDTDLAWTRLTPWRTLIAGMFDSLSAPLRAATVAGPADDPSTALLRGWLTARLNLATRLEALPGPELSSVRFDFADDSAVALTAQDGHVVASRTGTPDLLLPLVKRPLGEELAEELRRLGPDPSYAEALAVAGGAR